MIPEVEAIKELHDRTGHSYLVCRQALQEAEGDYEKALKILLAKTYENMRRSGGVME